MTSRKRLSISIVVLLAVYWVGVAGYLLIGQGVSRLDAMYMVAITLTTVGYREVLEPTPATVVWTMGILAFGFIAAMVFVGLLIALIVEGEVGRLIGSRQLESQIKHMQDHVIICGLGRMGTMLVKHLQGRRVPVVVVEKDPDACRQAEKLKALYTVGDATDAVSLEKAGIDRARSLVAAHGGDADNMFATLTARQMRPDLFIVARAEQFSAETKLRRAGANRVISPQAIGAERIANVLTRPHLVDFVEVAARDLEFKMDAVVIAADSPIAGKTLKEANIRATADVMVVAIREPDGTTHFNPGADEVLRPNDTLITIGPEGAASRLTELHIIASQEAPCPTGLPGISSGISTPARAPSIRWGSPSRWPHSHWPACSSSSGGGTSGGDPCFYCSWVTCCSGSATGSKETIWERSSSSRNGSGDPMSTSHPATPRPIPPATASEDSPRPGLWHNFPQGNCA